MTLRLIFALLLLLLLAACRGTEDETAVSLAQETLAGDYPLLTPLQTLQEKVHSTVASFAIPAEGRRVRVLSAEELALQTPYEEAETQDLILLVVSSPPRVLRNIRGLAVTEIRCYPCSGETSVVSVLGQRLRVLNPDKADKLLKATAIRTTDSSSTHCVYTQAYAQGSKLQLELTLSFRSSEGCYAAKLRLFEPAPKF